MSFRLLKPTFARGEISPLLHARVDLTVYQTALARLENFLVLPQGGLTRRPGFAKLGNAAVTGGTDCPVRLIPFVYNKEDAMVMELYAGHARFWLPSTGRPFGQVIDLPYRQSELKDVRYVQSGNFLFLTHRNHPIIQLERTALDHWEVSEFDFSGGPWLSRTTDYKEVKLRVARANVAADEYYLYSLDSNNQPVDFFDADMIDTLIELNYTISKYEDEGYAADSPSWYESSPVEVGGEWYLKTFDWWIGKIELQKSLDNGYSWLSIRTYERGNPDEEANIELSGSESETNVLYRVRAQQTEGRMRFTFTVSGFTKTNIFKISEIVSSSQALGVWQRGTDEGVSAIVGNRTGDWRLGAWGGGNGYPGCCCFYQDRFVLAGSIRQQLTVWMSRTGDYADFSVSSPLKEDDAISITVNSDDQDGIHSLVALSDVLAFTASGEWKIKGAGDYGAIAPNAVVAHQQDNVGSAGIQPLVVGGQPVFIQSHRTEAHVMQYVMDMDGYSGSNLSIMSGHLFNWKTDKGAAPVDRSIRCTAFQQVPDSLIWFVLADGSAVTCTYQAEHEVVAWARQTTDGVIGDVCCVPGSGHDQAWFAVKRGGVWGIERLPDRRAENLFVDAGSYAYESLLETLRPNLESQGGSVLSAKKLAPRVALFSVRSVGVWVTPVSDVARKKKRRLKWDYSAGMVESEIMVDAGFEKEAAWRIWVDSADPLTLLAISPMMAMGR